VSNRLLADLHLEPLANRFEARLRRYGLLACAAAGLAMLLGMLVQAASTANVSVLEAIGTPFGRLLGTQIG
jgi:hypothetical protein